MKSLGFNLKNAKKVAGDKDSSTFSVKDGHQIKVMHAPLSPSHRKQLEMMPVQKLADGGEANSSSVDDVQDSAAPVTTPDSTPDPSIASDIGAGLRTVAQNSFVPPIEAIKKGLGVAGDFVKGLTGNSDSSQQAAPDSSVAPPVSDLPGMGQPVGAPSPAARDVSSAPMSNAGSGADVLGAYNQGLTSANEQQKVDTAVAAQRAQAEQKYLQDSQDLMAKTQKNADDFNQHQKQFIDDYAKGHIDPKSYVENMSVPQKVVSAIGMILGGAGAGAGRPNPGAEFLNKQIDRNIQAQQARQDQQKTLLGANQDLYNHQIIGSNATRVQMGDMFAHQVDLAAAQNGGLQARANADKFKADWGIQRADLLNKMAVMKTLQDRQQQKAANPNAASDTAVDYPAMNLMQKTGIMPQQDVEAATKEAANAEEVRSIKNFYNSSFNALNSKTLGGALTPADRASYVNALSGKIQKISEGRYNGDAVQKLADGMLPGAVELGSTRQDKLANGNQFLDTLQAGTPTLNRYGLKNPLQQPQSAAAPQHKVGDVIYYKGQKMQIQDAKGNLKRVS